jgi:hypothetical protein
MQSRSMSIHPGSKLAFVLIAGIPQIVQTNAAKDLRTAVQVLPGLTVVGVSCAGKLPVFIIGTALVAGVAPAIARIFIAVVLALHLQLSHEYALLWLCCCLAACAIHIGEQHSNRAIRPPRASRKTSRCRRPRKKHTQRIAARRRESGRGLNVDAKYKHSYLRTRTRVPLLPFVLQLMASYLSMGARASGHILLRIYFAGSLRAYLLRDP